MATLGDLLCRRAEQSPGKTACRFLNERGESEITLTYQALLERASGIARRLAGHRDQRVLLLLPPGVDYLTGFFACMLSGAVAVPLYPPRRNSFADRVLSAAADCGAVVALSHRAVRENTATEAQTAIREWIYIEDCEKSAPLPKSRRRSEDLAFLQYSSGSVGTPNGVMVSHANLLSNLDAIARFSRQASDSRGFSWLPPYHDMGLIGGILFPIYAGFPVDLMSPQVFLRSPMLWLECLTRSKATISVAPNFALDLCVENVKPEHLERLDLGAWEVCFVGAEPIRSRTLERFSETFAACGFRAETFLPSYGLAEFTLLATGGPRDVKPATLALEPDAFERGRVVPVRDGNSAYTVVGCGGPADGHEVRIVDPQTLLPCAPDQIGEIWVSGPSLAQGYWNQPERTQEIFQARPKHADDAPPCLRTGDLGFMRNGHLYVTGRLHDLIIIRGRNYYPQDIERCAEQSHEALQPNGSVCFMDGQAGEPSLTLVLELRRSHCRTADTRNVMRAVRSAVTSRFELPVGRVVLLKPARLPRTSSGKVQRKATSRALAQSELATIDEWKPAEPGVSISTQLAATLEWLRAYGRTRINSQLIDERRCIPPHIVLDFGNRGLLGMEIPQQYGGPGFSLAESLKIAETLGAIDTTLALFVGVNNALGVRPILRYGSESLKRSWLPVLAAGRELAAFAITEPGAGANPQKIISAACIDGPDRWRLNGAKIWSGNAAWAGLIHVFAHETDDAGTHRGITAFALRQGMPGLRMGPESLTTGVRGMVQNSVHLLNVPVGAEHRLHESGHGMEVAQDAMVRGRLGIGAIAIGAMKRCAQLMVRYASLREIHRGTLLENPVSRERLSDLTAAITASEALVYRVAGLLDAGRDIPHDVISACKILIPELAWQAVDHLVQMLGGRGYEEPNMAARLMRDIRLLRIFEGPTETLCAYVGAKVCGRDRALAGFLSETWQHPAAAQALEAAVRSLNPGDRLSDSRHHACGELAAWAALWAAIPRDRDEHVRAIRWARSRFEACLEKAQKNESALTPGEIQSAVETYTKDLGTWEQAAPGANFAMDPLLRPDDPPMTSNCPDVPPPQIRSYVAAVSGDGRVERLVNRILSRLRQMPRIDAERLHPSIELISLGVDSITAIELTVMLEEELQMKIDPGMFWSFPTLRDLAAELVRRQDRSLPDSSPPSSGGTEKQATSENLAQLLAREISLNQQMIGEFESRV